MTAAPDELDDLVERMIDTRRRIKIIDLGPQRTLWLAAPPLWTRSAAETSGFPVDADESVTEFVARASAMGWCESRGSLHADGSTELHFWMPDEVRPGVLDVLRQLPGDVPRTVQDGARDIATRVVRRASELDLPGALRAWAELCADAEPDHIPADLLHRVIEAVDARDLGHAQELVTAGVALEPVVQGMADSKLTRARLVLDRGVERSGDAVALSRYLDRRELSGAVAELLTAGRAKWALDLRGVGGVGKSMFIRYLKSGRFAAERELPPIPMASVNFDHVSPDYPVHRPVQLLLELADELAPYAAVNDRAYRELRAFYDKADAAHQALSGLRDGIGRPLDDPGVRVAVDAFARVLNKLGVVLLILDTCEELAKWNQGNLNSEAIRTTLDILAWLHERASSVRVLLAGRRALPAREWLDTRTVEGFTLEEARDYLTLYTDPGLEPELAGSIIQKSLAVTDEPLPAPGAQPARVSPFDLALYVAWANEDPSLSVTDVEGGNDAYIERRIIRRLDSKLVTRALPMLAAGGKCRVETIATVLDCVPAILGRDLVAQEWINADSDTQPEFVTAWATMAERLRRFYAAPERAAEFAHVMHRFAAAVVQRLRNDPRKPVDVEEVVAALRWAERPAAAVALLDLLTGQATQQPGRWHVVHDVTERILGEWADGNEWPAAGALRAALLAARIAAHREQTPLARGRELWEQVLGSADAHPEPVRRRQLRVLAALGMLPCPPEEAPAWDILRAQQEILMGSPDVGTAAIDVMHRLLDAGHADQARQLLELLDLGSFHTAFDGPSGADGALQPADADRPMAWALVAQARLLADSDHDTSVAQLAEAERLASAARPERAWPYWVAPEDLLARVRIERGLIDERLITGPPDLRPVLRPWEDHAARHLSSVDGERLASLCLQLRLRHGTVAAEDAQRWESADANHGGRPATSTAHELVPPLFVSVAAAWLSAGRPERALALLEERLSPADEGNDDATIWQAAAAGIVSLARRVRLADQDPLLTLLTNPGEYQSAAGRARLGLLDDARRAWAVIYGEPPPETRLETDRLAGWHAWWQCQNDRVPDPVPPVPWSPVSPQADQADLADIRADLMEMRRLGRDDLTQLHGQLDALLGAPGVVEQEAPAQARSADPYRGLRLNLRWAALDRMLAQGGSEAPARAVAELACGEAELLDLRLPPAAAWAYWTAAGFYARCDDRLGRLLTLSAFHDALSRCSGETRGELLDALPATGVGAGARLQDAWDAFAVSDPRLAAILSGPPENAGPWRYWAETVQRTVQPARTGAAFVPPSEAPIPAAGAREAHRTMAALRAFLRIPALPLALVLAGGNRAAVQVAAGRAIGAAPIEWLRFDAVIDTAVPGTPDDTVWLRVRLRPWRSASSVRTWSRLRLRANVLSAWLLRSGWLARPAGYSGALEPRVAPSEADEVSGISWTPSLDSPLDSWWERHWDTPVPGTIRVGRSQADKHWERLLAGSLGQAAPGRIEWVRLAADQVRPVYSQGLGAELRAVPAWARALAGEGGNATPDPPALRVRHVIGRAVRRRAGPCMNISGDSEPRSNPTLLGVEALTRGDPALVVMQAEPTDDEAAGAVRHYDLADKLLLATYLLEAGVPAVLVLPVLPVSLTREVASLVTAYALAPGWSGHEVRTALLGPVRATVARRAGSAALDDVILLLNARYA